MEREHTDTHISSLLQRPIHPFRNQRGEESTIRLFAGKEGLQNLAVHLPILLAGSNGRLSLQERQGRIGLHKDHWRNVLSSIIHEIIHITAINPALYATNIIFINIYAENKLGLILLPESQISTRTTREVQDRLSSRTNRWEV